MVAEPEKPGVERSGGGSWGEAIGPLHPWDFITDLKKVIVFATGGHGWDGRAATSPTSGAMADGQEIAMRMIQAAEAASLAARTAAEALTRRNSGEESWEKALPKPGSFDAKNREEALAQWRDFSWSLEQNLSSLNRRTSELDLTVPLTPASNPTRRNRGRPW